MTKKAKQLGEEYAFSKAAFYHPDGGIDRPQEGLNIREYFAAKALQGLLSNSYSNGSYSSYAESAVQFADALLEELSKTSE
jgi:hypothetical protein